MAKKTVMIMKGWGVKSELRGKWYLEIADVGYLGMHENIKILFVADTRKEVKAYAESQGLTVDYIDSGRHPSGCRW